MTKLVSNRLRALWIVGILALLAANIAVGVQMYGLLPAGTVPITVDHVLSGIQLWIVFMMVTMLIENGDLYFGRGV